MTEYGEARLLVGFEVAEDSKAKALEPVDWDTLEGRIDGMPIVISAKGEKYYIGVNILEVSETIRDSKGRVEEGFEEIDLEKISEKLNEYGKELRRYCRDSGIKLRGRRKPKLYLKVTTWD